VRLQKYPNCSQGTRESYVSDASSEVSPDYLRFSATNQTLKLMGPFIVPIIMSVGWRWLAVDVGVYRDRDGLLALSDSGVPRYLGTKLRFSESIYRLYQVQKLDSPALWPPILNRAGLTISITLGKSSACKAGGVNCSSGGLELDETDKILHGVEAFDEWLKYHKSDNI
jgi:hypothetical protein